MELQTKRLILRPFIETDVEAVQSYAGNLENIRYMIWGPNTIGDTESFLQRCISKANAPKRLDYDFAVVLKETGQLIGGCGIYLNMDTYEGMLGWVLHMDHWKQGYGTELAAELIRFGFKDLHLHRIYATCYAENYGSYRVMERNHMRREAHFVKNRDGRGKWVDELVYAILKEEWENHLTKSF